MTFKKTPNKKMGNDKGFPYLSGGLLKAHPEVYMMSKAIITELVKRE